MSDPATTPPASEPQGPYRLLTIGLLVVAVAEAVALVTAFSGASDPAPTPLPPSPTAAAPAPAQPPQPPQPARPAGPRLVDLRKAIADFELATEKTDRVEKLYESNFGSVALRSVSPRHRLPLHFHRRSTEALVSLHAPLELLAAVPGSGKVKLTSTRPSTTEVAVFRPYTGHGYVNLSASEAAVVLDFAVPPREQPSFVAEGDDRLALGSTPEIADVAKEVATLAAGETFRLRRLEAMGGKLALLAATARGEIEGAPGATVVYFVSGQGKLTVGGTDSDFEAGVLAVLPGGASVAVSPAGGPVGALVFQPERDTVTDVVKKGKNLYSQFYEELLIRDFFHDRRDGVFLDVGCADYQRMSTTFYLEEKLGWSGVSVDALPDYAEGYRLHRPKTRFVNALVTDKPAGKQKFYRAPKYTELSSIDKKVAADQGRVLVGDDKLEEIEVESRSLDQILSEHKIGAIDFMSLDVEEHEPQALAGFDIAAHKPKLVCIEAHRATADAIYKFMIEHGYARLEHYLPYDGLNWYFAPR